MKKIYFLGLEIILLIIILFITPSLFILNRPNLVHDDGQLTLPLNPENHYSQSIHNPQHSLNSISLEMKNVGLQNHDRIDINLSDKSGNLLQNFVLNGDNISDPGWVKLDFEPLRADPILLSVSANNTFRDTLFLLGRGLNDFNIRASSFNPNFLHRLNNEINYQLHQLSQRDFTINITYLALLVLLNLLVLI